ncbi:MAG: helix-turn-helix domain-containing protein [Actinomycetota bacterium]
MPTGSHAVVAVALPGDHAFELGIACEVFGLDRPELGVSWYEFRVCAPEGRVDMGGFWLDTPHRLDVLADADTIIVPVAATEAELPAPLVEALAAAHARGARLVSYCSGAFALAAAGALDGRPATTHWMYARRLAERYPAVRVLPDVLYVDDGQVLTSAGTSAGIDLSLHIVRNDYGSAVANAVARRMVVPPHRDGGQAQFVDQPLPADAGATLGPTLEWIVHNMAEPLTVEHMAAHALMSTRTFMRRFRAVAGTTPLRFLLQQRVGHARRLLETTAEPVERIAQECGFGTAANLRLHFQRAVATTPTRYRRSFRGGDDPFADDTIAAASAG